jgi:RecA/RadA recombinase
MKKTKVTKAKAKTKEKEPKPKKAVKKSSSADFFLDLVASTENTLASAAINGIVAGDIRGWIDTGVYLLNAQISGSLYGGVPNNKIIVFAGEEAVGKTFFILSIIKHFLETNPEAGVVFFESESALTRAILEQRGIDTSRVFIVPVSTVQEWRTQSLKVLAAYAETPEKERRPMMFVLDSLGMLSTTKEMEDSESGKETADMTRSRLIKAAFRTLTLKLGILNVPFLITNHTYTEQGLFAKKVMSGGSGTKYSNSITVFLSKAKEKENEEVVGVIITSTLKKGRTTKENTVIKTRLNYTTGLDRYYGLLDLALEAKLVEKDGKQFNFNGNRVTLKQLAKDPTTYFTDDIMVKLEEIVQKKFNYGTAIDISEDDAEETIDDTDE